MTLTNAAHQVAADALVAAADALRALANEPTPAASTDIKIGDTVRLVGLSERGSDCDGQLATVKLSNYGGSDNVLVVPVGQHNSRIYRRDRVVKVDAAAAASASGVVRKFSTHSLKSGDRVEVVESSTASAVGKVGELDVCNDGSFGVVIPGWMGYTAVDAVKLVAQDVKVGDRVRVVDVAPWTEYFSPESVKGKFATVTAVGTEFLRTGEKGFTVRVDGKSSTNRVGKVEVVNSKVGDRVTVTEVAEGFMPEHVNYTGKIVSIGNTGRYVVAFDGYGMSGCTIVATKVTPLADDAPSVPAAPVKSVVPKPARSFQVYDGDAVNFDYLGKPSADPLTIDINGNTTVWVSDEKLDDLIEYLQAVKAHRAS